MATLDIDFPDDFLSELLETDFGEIAEEALSKAGPILEKSLKQECRRVIEHEGESELVNSFKCSKPVQTKNDAWLITVIPKGYSKTKIYYQRNKRKEKVRRYKVSNALKLVWKEYGVKGRQPARPFIRTACNNVENEVMKIIQEIYEKKVGMK